MTNGQVIIGNTSGTPTAATLTAGSNVTITNGTGSISIASAGSTPQWVKLGSQTASNSATLNFVSILSSTYNVYAILYSQILPVNNEVIFEMNLGTGSTPTWVTTGYQSLNSYFNASTNYAQVSTTDFQMSANGVQGGATTALGSTNGNLCGVVFLIGTNGSSATAAVSGTCTYLAGSGAPGIMGIGGTIGAATYTSLQFSMSAGNISSGTIEVFGVSK
jgi:hypothetical protein